MDDDPFVPHHGDELDDCQQARREDAGKMEQDSDLVLREGGVVVAFSRRGAGGTTRGGGAECAVEVEVLETGENDYSLDLETDGEVKWRNGGTYSRRMRRRR
jgi:hypothetical protein